MYRCVDTRQTWGEDRVYFHDDSGQLTRLPLQWTDVVPVDPMVVVGAGRAHCRYDDLCMTNSKIRRHFLCVPRSCWDGAVRDLAVLFWFC